MGGLLPAAAVRRRRLRRRPPGQPARRHRGRQARRRRGRPASCTTWRSRRPRSARSPRASASTGSTARARVVYEKPFGTSPESFRELDRVVHEVLQEDAGLPDRPLPRQGGHPGPARAAVRQRRVRPAVERRARTGGADRRARRRSASPTGPTFYDATGAMLDMIVTHLFQLAAEVAMETPPSLSAADLQSAREAVIAGSGRSTRTRWCSASSRATGTPRAWRRTRRPTRSSPPGCGSTRRAGTACRSCSAPASSSRRAPSRSA